MAVDNHSGTIPCGWITFIGRGMNTLGMDSRRLLLIIIVDSYLPPTLDLSLRESLPFLVDLSPPGDLFEVFSPFPTVVLAPEVSFGGNPDLFEDPAPHSALILPPHISLPENLALFDDLSVSGNLSVPGNLWVSGGVWVSGNLSVSGHLSVSGNLSVSGGLTVSGTISVLGMLSVCGQHSAPVEANGV